MNDFKSWLIVALSIAVVLLSTCNSCKNAEIAELKATPQKEVVKVVTKVDTIWQTVVSKTPVYVPQPYAIVQTEIRTKTDTVLSVGLPVDTAAILKDYYASAYYRDSVATQYGKVYITDTVSRNRIQARSVQTDFSIPTVTTTVTRTLDSRKLKGYLVGSVLGNRNDLVQAAGGGFMLQFKSDNAIEAQALFWSMPAAGVSAQTFQLSYKHKISFK